ncbi:MAG: hypothetical protein ABI425_02250 [Patescibacteria group bacterium]
MTTTDPTQLPTPSIPTGKIEIPVEKMDAVSNDSPLSPNEKSERAVSGSNPGVESDDNMLDNEKEVGLYTDVTEDDAPDLNIADQVEKAEKYHQDH